MPDNDQSLGDQQTYEGGAQPADSSDRSLGDQSTFGGGGDSSLSDIGGLTGDADLDMEIVDLSRYEVQETLGKGGMGEVLLATDTRLNRKVAIKRLLGDATKSQTAVRRFLTEAQSIAALNHFNIVQIHDYGRDKDGPFLIMEYVDGGSLLDRCRDGALPLDEAIDLTCQLCDGLGVAHESGIIHRDIKPANVLLTSRGEPKLTDFGLARQDTGDTGQTMAGAVLGTLDFMPSEQRKDATLTDNRSDLWSLAATLYQMLTGEPPRVIDLDTVPQQLHTTLSKALKTKPDARFQTAAEFRDALRASQKSQAAPVLLIAELGTGECPKCHAKNKADRKFCRDCGESLRLRCLSCSGDIPVWENFCAECGGNQKALTSARRAELDTQREQAESLRREYAFDESLAIVREIAAVEDSRLQHLNEWSETFVAETETEKARQQQDAQIHFAECQTHRRAFDYHSAINALEAIPEPMHTPEMSDYLLQLQSDQEDIDDAWDNLSRLMAAHVFRGSDEVISFWDSLGAYLDHEQMAGLQHELDNGDPGGDSFIIGVLRRFWWEERAAVLAQRPANVLPSITLLPNSIGMEFKQLPGGTFTMGDANGYDNATPHQVTLTKNFELGVYEVTQEQYERVMANNPSAFTGAQNPVEQVSWDDAVEFCRKLSELPEEKAAGHVYRLPTEAEWEYACRAGTTTAYISGVSESELGSGDSEPVLGDYFAWYDDNSGGTTHPVGRKNANGWGLYDMHGNVYEWCQDRYGDYPSREETDPTGPACGSYRVNRGGSWAHPGEGCRSASRSCDSLDYRDYSLGFRVLRSSIK